MQHDCPCAIVTGAASSSGIGFAICRALGHDGFGLILTDRDGDAVSARAEELRSSRLNAKAITHDVSDLNSWRYVFDVVSRSA